MEFNKSIQSAFELYQSGKLEDAENIARELLKGHPDNTEVLHLLGLVFYKRGDYDLALKNIRKVLRLDPNNSDAYYDLGNVLHDKGQTAKSLTNYRKAIKLNPKYVEAYNNMGIAFQDNMQLDKALGCYKKALNIDPNYAQAHNNLGVAFQEKGQLDEAITHFQQALLLRPDYANAYNNLVDAVQGKEHDNKHKSTKNIIYAIYRCYYGEDFIQESIRSITDYVDKIFVFVDKAPWGNDSECIYKGESIKFPKTFDNVVEKIREMNNSKIELVFEHQDVTDNQVTHLVNNTILPNHEKPSIILSLEVDHVFHSEQIKKAIDEFIEKDYVFATTGQIEIWKGFKHRLPDRPNRVGVVFCNLSKLDKMPETLKHGGILVMPKLSAYVNNFSFAVSDKVMYWKHLLSIALARKAGDVVPYENWYEEKWLKWDYVSNNENLGVSDQLKIERAIPYDVNDLPELIKEKFSN
ncbi:MAG: tetratricopeptide repeat protein [Thermodesulfovibrionales bacterium]|jgi:Flp pilus assembly protein TadD